MPPVPVIGDLIEMNQRLDAWCCNHACLHRRLIDPAEAIAMLGAWTTFPQAQRRLRCELCGARGREGMIKCRPSVEDFYRNRGHVAGTIYTRQ